jgi:tRNA(fMet)-specific endonuclease VapC
MSFLLDTCVVSESTKLVPSDKVLRWLETQNEQEFFISAITLAELWKGIAVLGKSKRRQKLEEFFEETVNTFTGRVIPVEQEVAVAWGNILNEMEKNGRPIPIIDGFLVATALAHELTFVTRNVSDFERTGIPIVNPWE